MELQTIPYKDIISLQLDTNNITYKKSGSESGMDAYIIDFLDDNFTPLSTIVETGVTGADLDNAIVESLCHSEQGKSFAEVSYLMEHFALADCPDYSVEPDIDAYMVSIQLSDDSSIMGALGKGYSFSSLTTFLHAKRIKVRLSDSEAISRLKTIEANIAADRMQQLAV